MVFILFMSLNSDEFCQLYLKMDEKWITHEQLLVFIAVSSGVVFLFTILSVHEKTNVATKLTSKIYKTYSYIK